VALAPKQSGPKTARYPFVIARKLQTAPASSRAARLPRIWDLLGANFGTQ
jgi:hypothetical protein